MPRKVICPNCGNQLEIIATAVELIVCNACNSSLHFDQGQLQKAGKMAILTEEPSIFSLRKKFKHKDWVFTPIGRVRYEYKDGTWDEWYVISENGATNWISYDEGDIAIESLVQSNISIKPFSELQIGEQLVILKQKLTVIELNTCWCIGAEGQLPFKPQVNEKYDYADLLGPKGISFTLEYYPDVIECYKGIWIDPFDISEA